MPQPQTISPEMREFYEERAAIREFDGGQSRGDAEKAAWAETQARFKPKQARQLDFGAGGRQ